MIARIERWFEASYQRAPERHLARARRSVLVLLFVLVGILVLVALPYLDPTPAETMRTLVAAELLVVVGGVFVLNPAWKRLHADVERWLTGDRSEQATLTAWRQSKHMSFEGVRVAYVWFGPIAFILGPAFAMVEFDLSPTDFIAVFVGLLTSGVLATTAGWPLVEAYLRPLRRDLATRIPATEATAVVAWPLPGRVTGFLATMSVLTGAVALLFITRGSQDLDDVWGPLLLIIGVGVVVGSVFGSMVARSLLAPLGDLVEVSKEVARGDLSARALVTSDDEIGLLGAEFNTMLANLAAAVDEVRASRARIVAASDAERRRIERNIHDGAQQQLTTLALQLQMMREHVHDPTALEAGLQRAIDQLRESMEELRILAQGLHPSILSSDGLGPALRQLAARSPIPVQVETVDGRFGEVAESTAYFVASEGLANVVKHARASSASLVLARSDGHVVLEVTDDGAGGARLAEGSGLAGLADRVAAVGGRLTLQSSSGRGTTIRAELPAETPDRGLEQVQVEQ